MGHQLPAEVITEGRVSDLQIEDVIYAGQATEAVLPNGSRKGPLEWRWHRDRQRPARCTPSFTSNCSRDAAKHVHISASHQLCADAQRDRDAVGVPPAGRPPGQVRPGRADSGRNGSAVHYVTRCSAWISEGERQRFKQLTDWLGPDFDGVIAFDEAPLHEERGGPHRTAAGRTVDEGTLRGNMGISLQRLYPQARIRYFSATGATEARHMAPYERLGALGGQAPPFPDFSAFSGSDGAWRRGGNGDALPGPEVRRHVSVPHDQLRARPAARTEASYRKARVEYEPLIHRPDAGRASAVRPNRRPLVRVADRLRGG